MARKYHQVLIILTVIILLLLLGWSTWYCWFWTRPVLKPKIPEVELPKITKDPIQEEPIPAEPEPVEITPAAPLVASCPKFGKGVYIVESCGYNLYNTYADQTWSINQQLKSPSGSGTGVDDIFNPFNFSGNPSNQMYFSTTGNEVYNTSMNEAAGLNTYLEYSDSIVDPHRSDLVAPLSLAPDPNGVWSN